MTQAPPPPPPPPGGTAAGTLPDVPGTLPDTLPPLGGTAPPRSRAVALWRAAVARLDRDGRARAVGFAAIGLSGFAPNLALLWLLTSPAGMHEAPAVVLANQAGILWNFLLTDRLLYGGPRTGRERPWTVRLLTYAGLSNTDLLLRVPLTTWLVSGPGGNVVAVTAVLLLLFAAARFAVIDRLLYGSRKRSPKR